MNLHVPADNEKRERNLPRHHVPRRVLRQRVPSFDEIVRRDVARGNDAGEDGTAAGGVEQVVVSVNISARNSEKTSHDTKSFELKETTTTKTYVT